jgi:Zn-finger nucleic acid-binding protein
LITLGALRQFAPADRVNALWRETWRGAETSPLDCSACGAKMRRVTVSAGAGGLELDACKACQSIWFDVGELAALSPERQAAATKEPWLPESERREFAETMASEIAKDARDRRRAEAMGSLISGGNRRGALWIVEALVDLWRA